MNRLLAAGALIVTLSSIALGAAVVTTITYVAGETRPLTVNTDGELRVSCD